jgi:hypothetical protein
VGQRTERHGNARVPTCHVENQASQGPQCLFCKTILAPRRSGRPQEFCPGGRCRRLFWQEARRLGGRILRRRLKQRRGRRPRVRRPVLRLPRAEYKDLRTFVATAAAWG